MIWVLVFLALGSGDPDVGVIERVFHSEKECRQVIAENPPPENIKPFCLELDSI